MHGNQGKSTVTLFPGAAGSAEANDTLIVIIPMKKRKNKTLFIIPLPPIKDRFAGACRNTNRLYLQATKINLKGQRF